MSLWTRLRNALAGERLNREIDDELRSHVAEAVERGRDAGEAKRAFGPELQRREESRDAKLAGWLDSLRADVAFGWRQLHKNKITSAAAILSLALGMGANTALFSVVNALLLRSLPVRHPEQLVSLSDPQAAGLNTGIDAGERDLFTFHEFEGLRDNDRSLAGMFATSASVFPTQVAPSDSATGAPANVSMVSGSYFNVLGAQPILGRTFSADVDRGRGDAPFAVLSSAFLWNHMQDGGPVLGRKIRIGHTVFDVIGVMGPEFTGISVGDAPDIWVPATMQQAIVPGQDWLSQPPGSIRRIMFLHILGRLRGGVSVSQANASLNTTFHNLLQADGDTISDTERRKELESAWLRVRDARHGVSEVRGVYGSAVAVLMGLVALLLLLACVNVANLLSARTAARRQELAMRIALGAGRGRLARQLLTESLLLSVAGGVAGLLAANWGVRMLLRMVSSSARPLKLDARLDGQVLLFTIGVMLATGLFFGLAPAVRAMRLDRDSLIRGNSRSVSGSDHATGRIPMGKLLVGLQAAMSLMLLVSAGLFVRSLQKLTAVPLGYEAEHLLVFRINPSLDGFKKPAIPGLIERLEDRFAAIPGVRAVSFSNNGLFGGGDSGDDITIVGDNQNAGRDMSIRLDEAGPQYFSTIGIRVLDGRDVGRADTAGTHHMWINQNLRRYYFGDANPLGRHIVVHYSFGDTEYDVVGVVADAKSNSLRGPTLRRAYISELDPWQPLDSVSFEVRCAADCGPVTAAIRSAIRQVDAELSLPRFGLLRELIDESLLRDRLMARLSTFFGGLALLLACVGVYGILSYSVAQRTGEMGVRVALGAKPRDILRLVLRDALVVTGVGAAAGVCVALAAGRVLQSMLYSLTPHDAMTLAGATALLLAMAILAAFLPAWRAARVDPVEALRAE